MENTSFALITGASRGLGRAFAYHLAECGINTILISLPGELIEEVAGYCQSCGTESHFYEIDLTDKPNLIKLTEKINAKYSLFMLVNNAGMGGSRAFVDSTIQYVDNIIQLNVTALTLLTHQFLPNLKRQKQAYILNISSMASFTPTGYKTVYPASKDFILNFSLGLNEELKGSGVSVSVAMLGPMKTSEDIIRRIEQQGALAKFILLNPDEVARVCIKKMLKHKKVIIVGWTNKFSRMVLRMCPVNMRVKVMTAVVKKKEIQIA